ncbi:FAD-dependent oxidoreductase [Fodinisporobacter ferrooxydans]|uniref:FAD-dependent oxidoreductase n=1 Tax=Fodinisporobacter ferrooxydans TaxID=2901836 RepID=A0ABY4CHT6_9BACL|nr:FAD-dependent oxidoreductase [Alicyclobacillaceae bacterium MYW30-H2]
MKRFDVVVVGGGLAGLSAAAHLSHSGKKVLLLEKANLGGRAVTINIKGFAFNFGAHAIYGRDTSVLKQLEKELDIHIDWKDFNPLKAKYDIGEELTAVPANVVGLFRTKAIQGMHKLSFVYQIVKTLIKAETGNPHISIRKWLEQEKVSNEVKEMMLTLASSNFFTREPEKIPSDIFFTYYRRIFTTNKPVAYIGGGWQNLISEFVRVIEQNDGVIQTKAKVDEVKVEEDRVTAVCTKDGWIEAEEFIFCIPPSDLLKLFENTKIEYAIKQYAQYDPTYVLVYDIGLKNKIEVPYTYVYNRKDKVFITDISYYDTTCVPEGGQLLQATTYLKNEDIGNKDVIDRYKKNIEDMYDKYFSGWRDELVVPRISQKAVVQEIKWNMHQQAMPLFFPEYRNLFFAGDWCEGQGQLSELSFSSAYQSSQYIMQKQSMVLA